MELISKSINIHYTAIHSLIDLSIKIQLSIHWSIYQSIYLYIHRSYHLSTSPSFQLSIPPFVSRISASQLKPLICIGSIYCLSWIQIRGHQILSSQNKSSLRVQIKRWSLKWILRIQKQFIIHSTLNQSQSDNQSIVLIPFHESIELFGSWVAW